MSKPDANSESAEQVLDAAVRLFARKGLAATSVREIVEAAGTTKPTLYYYFGSKEGICRAALTRAVEFLEHRIGAALAKPCDARKQLVEVVWGFFEVRIAHPDASRLAIVLLYGPETEVPGLVVSALHDRLNHIFGSAAETACSAGLVEAGSRHRFLAALRGAIIASLVTPTFERPPELSRRVAEQVVDDLLYGFAVSRS